MCGILLLLSELLLPLHFPQRGIQPTGFLAFSRKGAPCHLVGGASAKGEAGFWDSALPCACKLMQVAVAVWEASRGTAGITWQGFTECPEGKTEPWCCPPLQGKGGSWAGWLHSGTCLDSLMQADLSASHFYCYNGLERMRKKTKGKEKKKNKLEKEKWKCLFQEKDLLYQLQWRNARKTAQLSSFSLLFEKASPTLQLLSSLPADSSKVTQQERPGKLLLTWVITSKCLDRTSYCLEYICIYSQCNFPWKALCRSPAFWAFPVVLVFQSKPIWDEFWACLGMWLPSYILVFMH